MPALTGDAAASAREATIATAINARARVEVGLNIGARFLSVGTLSARTRIRTGRSPVAWCVVAALARGPAGSRGAVGRVPAAGRRRRRSGSEHVIAEPEGAAAVLGGALGGVAAGPAFGRRDGGRAGVGRGRG